MGHWALVRFAVRICPPRGGRSRIWRHIDRCSTCQSRLAGLEETRRCLVRPEDVGRLDRIWPEVSRKVCSTAAEPLVPLIRRTGNRIWRWGAAVAAIGCAAFLTFAAVRFLGSGTGAVQARLDAAGESLRIHYARVDGHPAETFIVDLPADRMVVVWVAKRSEKEGQT
jgi:hypothetical protein